MARMLCPTLIGRREEAAQLHACVEASLHGAGGVVLVTGTAGIGKTRLITAAAELAETHGVAVLRGRAVPSEVPAPYRPIAEALLAATRSDQPPESAVLHGFRGALGRLVPSWREDAANLPDESPIVVAEALLRVLRTLAGGTASLLVIEDLQWADPESLHAIEYLADHARALPIVCLGTVRDEPGTAAIDMATRLEARRAVELVKLGPLPADDVAAMASACLGSSAVPDEVQALLGYGAEGIPFLVEELLAAATAGEVLVYDQGGWSVAGELRPLVPRSFAESIRRRLMQMGTDGRRILGIAAILGRHFDWLLAIRAAECSPATARSALNQALALQLLSSSSDGFSFRHALTREAVVHLLLPDERADLAGRALAALEMSVPVGDDWRHLAADLAEAARQEDRAAALLLGVGRTSFERGALATATAALERARRLARRPAIKADTEESLAAVRSTAGDLAGTRSTVMSLLETLHAMGGAPARRGQAHLVVARTAVMATHFDLGSEELARARRLAVLGGDSALTARVDAVSAQLAIGEGRLGEAQALALRAVEEAGQTHQPEVLCEALEVAGRCARTHDLSGALDIFTRAAQVAEDAGLAVWRMRALYQLGTVDLLGAGDIVRLEQARDEAQRLGAVATAASLDLEIGAGLDMLDRGDEALAALGRCVEVAALLGLRILEAMAHTFTAIVHAERCARRPMEDAIARALALAGDDREVIGAIWGDARAIASLAEEDRSRALRELHTAVASFPATPAVAPRPCVALHALLSALDGGQPDRSAVAEAMGLVYQAQGYLAYAEAIVHGRAGRRAEAAEAAALGDRQLAKAPYYRHLVHRLSAEAAIANGWGDPRSWLTEAAAYFDEAGHARLASACRGLLRRAGIRVARPTRAARVLPASLREAGVTARESEVLALVGAGLSNSEIAERLVLSERTVEHHVGWLRRKLSLQTRAQMVAHVAAEVDTTPRR